MRPRDWKKWAILGIGGALFVAMCVAIVMVLDHDGDLPPLPTPATPPTPTAPPLGGGGLRFATPTPTPYPVGAEPCLCTEISPSCCDDGEQPIPADVAAARTAAGKALAALGWHDGSGGDYIEDGMAGWYDVTTDPPYHQSGEHAAWVIGQAAAWDDAGEDAGAAALIATGHIAALNCTGPQRLPGLSRSFRACDIEVWLDTVGDDGESKGCKLCDKLGCPNEACSGCPHCWKSDGDLPTDERFTEWLGVTFMALAEDDRIVTFAAAVRAQVAENGGDWDCEGDCETRWGQAFGEWLADYQRDVDPSWCPCTYVSQRCCDSAALDSEGCSLCKDIGCTQIACQGCPWCDDPHHDGVSAPEGPEVCSKCKAACLWIGSAACSACCVAEGDCCEGASWPSPSAVTGAETSKCVKKCEKFCQEVGVGSIECSDCFIGCPDFEPSQIDVDELGRSKCSVCEEFGCAPPGCKIGCSGCTLGATEANPCCEYMLSDIETDVRSLESRYGLDLAGVIAALKNIDLAGAQADLEGIIKSGWSSESACDASHECTDIEDVIVDIDDAQQGACAPSLGAKNPASSDGCSGLGSVADTGGCCDVAVGAIVDDLTAIESKYNLDTGQARLDLRDLLLDHALSDLTTLVHDDWGTGQDGLKACQASAACQAIMGAMEKIEEARTTWCSDVNVAAPPPKS